MVFNTFDFLVFFLCVFTLQLCLPHRPRNLFLLAASYFFYACWDWRFLGLMALSTIVDYRCSHVIHRSKESSVRRRVLAISIATNLIILGFFKYAGFFVDSWLTMLSAIGVDSNPRSWRIILPVGISFYTFQTMSYTWDVYRKEVNPLERLSDFALYVAFFPQLVAGPIERGKKLSPQIESGTRTTVADLESGGWLVFKGLFKKAVIADNLAPIVDSAFSLDAPTGAQVLVGVYAFAFQIYGDFSGYTDIARGIGRLLGYELSLNFRLPYFASNPSEFWQRWHISLSSWLRDYLYIPLGGNRFGRWNTYRNLIFTMLLGGLWHGAAWTFILWGLYHGMLLTAHRYISESGSNDMETSQSERLLGANAMRMILMFHLTCIGWLIFRSDSLENLMTMVSGLTNWDAISIQDQLNIWKLCMLGAPLMLVHCVKEYSKNLNLIPNLSVVPRLTAYVAMAVALLTIGSFGKQEFIYFQF